MRYRMKRNLPADQGDFAVKDEYGRDVLLVGGRSDGPGDRLSFSDPRRRELAYVRRRMSAAGAAYEIVYADELHSVVNQKLVTGSCATFSGDLPAPDDLCAAGDFPGCEYTFTRDGRTVATVSRSPFANPETYGVEVGKGEDEVLILASAVVIDLCCREPRECREARSA